MRIHKKLNQKSKMGKYDNENLKFGKRIYGRLETGEETSSELEDRSVENTRANIPAASSHSPVSFLPSSSGPCWSLL